MCAKDRNVASLGKRSTIGFEGQFRPPTLPGRLKDLIKRRRQALRERRQVKKVQSITGTSRQTARRIVREQLVDQTLNYMNSIGFDPAAMRRVVGYKLGQLEAIHLNESELSVADSRVGELAAVKGLAQVGFWDLEIAAAYSWTGYQRSLTYLDPVLGHLKDNYIGGPIAKDHLDILGLGSFMRDADARELRKISVHAWHYADPGSRFAKQHPQAHAVWREVLSCVDPEVLRLCRR